MKISVFIEGGEETLTLDRSLVVTEGQRLFVKTATIFWNYKNVFKGYNDQVFYSGVKHTFEEGYWDFKAIATKLLEIDAGIILTKNAYDSTCTIVTVNALELFKLGELLGFDENTILMSRSTTSPNKADINRGLRFIKICCDTLVDDTVDTNGKRSSVIATLPVTTKSSLRGSVTRYVDVESRVPIHRGTYNNLSFRVETNTGLNLGIGSVLIDMYIL